MLPAYPSTAPGSQLPRWNRLGRSQIRSWPLQGLSSATDRTLTRLACLLARRQVVQVEGWENILPRCDPFLLVANHSSRREAVYLPAILLLARAGRTVRFLADWNYRLVPGIGYFYKHTGTITLTRKSARPRILNLFKPLFEPEVPPLEEARRHLVQGGSVAIFPEGTVNRDPDRLLRGRRAAARLSLETGVPVVPVGIRFARHDRASGLIDSSSPMSIHIGKAMAPRGVEEATVPPHLVTAWNRQLMSEIGRLCGKKADGLEGGSPGQSRDCGPIAQTAPPFSE